MTKVAFFFAGLSLLSSGPVFANGILDSIKIQKQWQEQQRLQQTISQPSSAIHSHCTRLHSLHQPKLLRVEEMSDGATVERYSDGLIAKIDQDGNRYECLIRKSTA